ncbi:unnamed protein product [Ilex paraguariensis]|uniref:RRM domain-containing protein n=1 Tax=Ilex paraguariensis TaxID=185542 RepID=A0ABC8RHF7_9AQUA
MDTDRNAHSLFTPKLKEERDQKEDGAMCNTNAFSVGWLGPPPSSPLNKPLMIYSKIINDCNTGRSKGFRSMTFKDEQSMRDAIESVNGQDLDGDGGSGNNGGIGSSDKASPVEAVVDMAVVMTVDMVVVTLVLG